MQKSKDFGSKAGSAGAIINVRTGSDKQSLEEQEVSLRAYCTKEKMEVLCVLREKNVPEITEAIKLYSKQYDKVSLLMCVDILWGVHFGSEGMVEVWEKSVVAGRFQHLDGISPSSYFFEVYNIIGFTTDMGASGNVSLLTDKDVGEIRNRKTGMSAHTYNKPYFEVFTQTDKAIKGGKTRKSAHARTKAR